MAYYLEYSQDGGYITAIVGSNPKSPYVQVQQSDIDSMGGMFGAHKIISGVIVKDQALIDNIVAARLATRVQGEKERKAAQPKILRKLVRLVMIATKNSPNQAIIDLRAEILAEIDMLDS